MKPFLCTSPQNHGKIVIVGLPYDSTTSFKPGARFGPEAIRSASYGLESYDPLLNLDLEEVSICDLGDIELPYGSPKLALQVVKNECKKLCNNKLVVALGGEHLLTVPLVELVAEKYNSNIFVIQIDAHADLRNDYLGEPLSHACTMRRIAEIVGFERIKQVGIRSGTKEEWQLIRKHNTLIKPTPNALKEFVNQIGNTPVYITVDLDVLDPSVLPGTGAPEPGGLNFNELQDLLIALRGANIVGVDVMELAPNIDNSGVSSVVAAKVVRTILLILANAESE